MNLITNMSLHEMNPATDVDQDWSNIKDPSVEINDPPSVSEETVSSNGNKVQQDCLVIRLGQRDIKLMI